MQRSPSTCWDAPACIPSAPEHPGIPWNTETFASPSVTGGEAAQGGGAKAKGSTST